MNVQLTFDFNLDNNKVYLNVVNIKEKSELLFTLKSYKDTFNILFEKVNSIEELYNDISDMAKCIIFEYEKTTKKYLNVMDDIQNHIDYYNVGIKEDKREYMRQINKMFLDLDAILIDIDIFYMQLKDELERTNND